MPETAVVLNVRNVDPAVRERMLRASAARGMTLAQYIAAIVALHDAMRAIADSDEHPQVWAELEALGLNTTRA